MNNFIANYGKILGALQQVEKKMNFLNQICVPLLSDIELIAVDLTSEYMGIDSEHQLFRILPNHIRDKIERSVYNRRKRKLFYFRLQLRKRLTEKISSDNSYMIVDSMPLEVCKLNRSTRSKICKEVFPTSPDKGYCA